MTNWVALIRSFRLLVVPPNTGTTNSAAIAAAVSAIGGPQRSAVWVGFLIGSLLSLACEVACSVSRVGGGSSASSARLADFGWRAIHAPCFSRLLPQPGGIEGV